MGDAGGVRVAGRAGGAIRLEPGINNINKEEGCRSLPELQQASAQYCRTRLVSEETRRIYPFIEDLAPVVARCYRVLP